MKKPIILLILMVLLFAPLIIAEVERYPRNKEVDLKYTCTLNYEIPSDSTEFNITISYPNGTTFINNLGATALGNGAFNYTTTFTEFGTYKVQMFCYDGTYSYSEKDYYEITNEGREAPSGIVVVLFSVLFLIILGSALFQFILIIGHLASLDLDVLDLAKSMGIYFALLMIYQLSLYYLGNPALENWLLIFIKIGSITHIVLPLTGFLFSITLGSLKRKKVDFGVNRIYKRQKIGK